MGNAAKQIIRDQLDEARRVALEKLMAGPWQDMQLRFAG